MRATTRWPWLVLGVGGWCAVIALHTTTPHAAGGTHSCARCGWAPATPGRNTHVARSAAELLDLAARATRGATILIEDGEYTLPRTLEITTPQLTLRGRSGDPARVVLRGTGMGERTVGVGIAVGASGVSVADLTVAHVGFHGVQIRGERGVTDVTVHNVRVLDTGQQLLKGSAGGGAYADRVLVACSSFEYTTTAPGHYTNGVDVLGGRAWTVRDNRFVRIRGPEAERWGAGPAILFWANAQDTLVERNLVIDSFRGIAFGLGPATSEHTRPGGSGEDHARGAIRNNVIVNLHAWADEGIEANAARGFSIDHNTVLVTGRLPWSISVRFPESDGKVRNNLTVRPVMLRDGGVAGTSGNIDAARPDWFVNAPAGEFHLTRLGRAAVDAGVPLPGIPHDYYRRPRIAGASPDAGAAETETRR